MRKEVVVVVWRPMRNINLRLPEQLLVEVDEAAKELYMSRTEYIRYVLNKQAGGRYPRKIEELSSKDLTRFLDLDDS